MTDCRQLARRSGLFRLCQRTGRMGRVNPALSVNFYDKSHAVTAEVVVPE